MTVTLVSEGLTLVGDLRRPSGAGPFPAIVLTGPFTGVRDPVVGTYAERLCDRGFVTLAFTERMGADAYAAAWRGFLEGYDDLLPAVAADEAPAAMGGDEPYRYYGTERGASPTWRNRVPRGSLHSLMTFDALGAAPLLACTPLLVVHGRKDDYCSPELAQQVYDAAAGPREIRWLEADEHIDLYDVEPHVQQAVRLTEEFLHRAMTDRAAR